MSKIHILVVALLAGLLITLGSSLYTSSTLTISRPTLTTTTSLPQNTACLDVMSNKTSGGAPLVFVESQKINSCQTVTKVYPLGFIANWLIFTAVTVACIYLYRFLKKIIALYK